MPNESDLRSRMREPDEPGRSGGGAAPDELDVDSVIRRARARRLPRQIAIAAASTLAVVAIVVPVTLSSLNTNTSSSLAASDSGMDAGGSAVEPAPESATTELKRAPADRLNLCTGTVAEVQPAASGLVFTVAPVEASAGKPNLDAVVTLTNAGTSTVVGTTSGAPSLTLSQGGVVLWHSNGPSTMLAIDVDLAPGESMVLPATFRPAQCGVDDDASPTGFRETLPSLPAGSYQLSAAMDFLPTDGFELELVTGPAADVILR